MPRLCDMILYDTPPPLPPDDEYLRGVLRVRVTSANDLKAKPSTLLESATPIDTHIGAIDQCDGMAAW